MTIFFNLVVVFSIISYLIMNDTCIVLCSSLSLLNPKYHPLPPTQLSEYNKKLYKNHHHHNGNEINIDNVIPRKMIKNVQMRMKSKEYQYSYEYESGYYNNKYPKSSYYNEKVIDMYQSNIPVYYETIFSQSHGFIQKYTASDNDNNSFSILYQKSTGLLVEYTLSRTDGDDTFSIQHQYKDHDIGYIGNDDNKICPNGFPELEEIKIQIIEENAFDFLELESEEDDFNNDNKNNLISFIRKSSRTDNKSLLYDDDDKVVVFEEEEKKIVKNMEIESDISIDEETDYITLFLLCSAVLFQFFCCHIIINKIRISILKKVKNGDSSEHLKDYNPFDTKIKYSSLLDISTISYPNSPVRISRSPVRGDQSPIRTLLNN